MADFADGVGIRASFKAESAWDTLPGATGAQQIDRIELTPKQDIAKIENDEKRASRQQNDVRAGSRKSDATLRGRLKGSVFGDFLAGLFMNTWATGPTTGAIAVIAASASAPHFVRSTGSFITNGFKVGMIMSPSGFAGGGVANNTKRWKITVLTATQMTVANIDGTTATVAAEVEGASVTIATPGKILQVASASHVFTSFTLEKYFQYMATPKAMLARGQFVNSIDLSVDQDANIGIDVGFLGRRYEKHTSAPYFTTPTAPLNRRIMNSVYGSLVLNGAEIGHMTGLKQQFMLNQQQNMGVFNKYASFVGGAKFTGNAQISAYVKDANLRDLAEAETEFALAYYFTGSPDFATADLMAVVQPRGQLFEVQENDDDKAVVENATFVPKEGTGTGAEASTAYLQDTSL